MYTIAMSFMCTRRTYKVIGKARCNENSTGPPCTGYEHWLSCLLQWKAWLDNLTHKKTTYIQICRNDGSCVLQSSLEVCMAYDSGIALRLMVKTITICILELFYSFTEWLKPWMGYRLSAWILRTGKLWLSHSNTSFVFFLFFSESTVLLRWIGWSN